MKVDADQLVAVVDIARLFNVRPSAVSNWIKREIGFPEPVVRVANGDTGLWLRDDVLLWYSNRHSTEDLEAQIARTRATLEALERAKGGRRSGNR